MNAPVFQYWLEWDQKCINAHLLHAFRNHDSSLFPVFPYSVHLRHERVPWWTRESNDRFASVKMRASPSIFTYSLVTFCTPPMFQVSATERWNSVRYWTCQGEDFQSESSYLTPNSPGECPDWCARNAEHITSVDYNGLGDEIFTQ